MSKRGICKNCEREMVIMQEGMCGSCCLRAKGLESAEREDALAKARAAFKGKWPVSPGNRAPRKPKTFAASASTRKSDRKPKDKLYHPENGLGIEIYPAPLREVVRLPDVQVAGNTIILTFDNGDENMLACLKTLAQRYRRSPVQQLLWILEHELAREGIIPISGTQEVVHG